MDVYIPFIYKANLQENNNKQRVLMHRHQGWNVRHGLCHIYMRYTVETPYNTNGGVQKIPDRAIWKPVVAKRNNTNPWSCSEPQILVTRDSRRVHMAEQPASRDRLE